MFSFFRRKPKEEAPAVVAPEVAPAPVAPEPTVQAVPPVNPAPAVTTAAVAPVVEEAEITPAPAPAPEQKKSWLSRLKAGLAKTSSSLTTLFVGARIDDDLYDELEAALLTADAGVEATLFLLDALKKKVKEENVSEETISSVRLLKHHFNGFGNEIIPQKNEIL